MTEPHRGPTSTEKIQRDGRFPAGGQREQWKREKERAREPKPEPPKPAEPEPKEEREDDGD